MKVYIIIGYPGAGKTTLLDNLLGRRAYTHTINDLKVQVVHGDEVMYKNIIKLFVNLISKVDVLFYERANVPPCLIDFLATKAEVEVCLLDTPREECIRRWEEREWKPMTSIPLHWYNEFETTVRVIEGVHPIKRIDARWVPPELAGVRG